MPPLLIKEEVRGGHPLPGTVKEVSLQMEIFFLTNVNVSNGRVTPICFSDY